MNRIELLSWDLRPERQMPTRMDVANTKLFLQIQDWGCSRIYREIEEKKRDVEAKEIGQQGLQHKYETKNERKYIPQASQYPRDKTRNMDSG